METFVLNGLAFVLHTYYWLMIVYFLSSWIPSASANKVIQLIEKLVEPYLTIFRKVIPPIGMLDVSSIVAIISYRILSAFALAGLVALLDG